MTKTRALLLLAPLALIAAPAQAEPGDLQIPPEFTSPEAAATLGKMMGTLTRVILDLPVGELQAAMEGREITAADKSRTVRDLTGRNSDLERKVERQVAESLPRMQAGLKAMSASLPAMAKAMEKAAEEMESGIDRAAANLPTPGYPKR